MHNEFDSFSEYSSLDEACKSRSETAVKSASTDTSFSSNLMFKRSLGCRCYQVLNLDLDIRFPQLPLSPIIVDKLTIQNL